MTIDTVALLAGALLSVLFSYVPGLNTAFAALAPVVKRLIMAGLMLAVVLFVYLEACTGFHLLEVASTCDQAGAVGLIRVFVLAVVANQGMYSAVQQPKEVREISATSKANAGGGAVA